MTSYVMDGKKKPHEIAYHRQTSKYAYDTIFVLIIKGKNESLELLNIKTYRVLRSRGVKVIKNNI